MGLLDCLFAAPYAERKVDRFEKGGLIVDTCSFNDSPKPFETGVQHPRYNSGKWVVVECYDTKAQAQAGHKKWVKRMTGKKLPRKLKDVSGAEVAELCRAFGKMEYMLDG